MIITKTPYRVSLFGGGTDFPAWYKEHGGSVLSFAIDKYCYITARNLPPFFEHNYRIAYSKVETVKHFNEITHPVVRETIKKYAFDNHLEIHHDGDLPARSGVGSSSAFTVGLIHALLAISKQNPSPTTLAQLAIEMEQNILKENVGSQDQIACALGGINLIKFGKGDKWVAERVDIGIENQQKLQENLTLVYTGQVRNSSLINASLIEGISRKGAYLNRLQEMAHLCQSILQNGADFRLIGEMLDESWHLKRKLNSQASNSNLNYLYQKALKSGATGGKILGAGGGGFFLFWVNNENKERFTQEFSLGVHIPLKVSNHGSMVIYKDLDH